MKNPQCIHIPDGSVVIAGDLFDDACAAFAERDRLMSELAQLDADACGERAERESWKHAFENFHRLLCERFGYVHDEKHWLRDQVSLIEHIIDECNECGGNTVLPVKSTAGHKMLTAQQWGRIVNLINDDRGWTEEELTKNLDDDSSSLWNPL